MLGRSRRAQGSLRASGLLSAYGCTPLYCVFIMHLYY